MPTSSAGDNRTIKDLSQVRLAENLTVIPGKVSAGGMSTYCAYQADRLASHNCMPRTTSMQARSFTGIIGAYVLCLQGITCSVLSSWKFKPQLTPLHFTMAAAARPDAIVSEQQVHVDISIGNRRLVETQNIHVPRYA